MFTHSEALAFIEDKIHNNDVVLFMKGTTPSPQCGFSNIVVKILQNLKVSFIDVNVLIEPEVRNAIKEYSQWPTVPQLYIQKEFIGGCDIVKELFMSGELVKILTSKELIKAI
jgi:monothiol glutaredoxin